MATGTFKVYAPAIAKAFNAEINYLSDTIKMAICTSAYTPNQATHDYFNDVTNETSGTGYTAGGATLGTKSVTLSTLTYNFDAADVVLGSSSFTGRVLVVYKSTGTASTSPLICYCTLSGDETSVSGNWSVVFDVNGIFGITVS